MKVKVTTWKVSYLYGLREKINAQPKYQRGEVWKDRKKALLVDSMLRGIDIPKIYLRKVNIGAHEFEVADGQQRLNAIFEFYEDTLILLTGEEKGLNLQVIDGKTVGGKSFSEIDQNFQDDFKKYEISVAIVEEATNSEIRVLFGRLQEGEPLVPAEKRNAILSTIGDHIDTFAINHNFFINSRIAPERYKRQDYLSHGMGLVFYSNRESLKASLLSYLYLDKSITCSMEMQGKIAGVLDKMFEIDHLSTTRIHKKYHFIDIFWFLWTNFSKIDLLNTKDFAEKFDALESKRLAIKDPESLLTGNNATKENRDLFTYYTAFRFAGAEPENITKRLNVFNATFEKAFVTA